MDPRKVLSFRSEGSAGITGPLYEIRLALLFMIRGLVNDFERFQVGCNLPEEMVRKLDDVVFLYNLKSEPNLTRGVFVQAKNKNGTGISLDSLKLEVKTADFNLQKYFESYQTIIKSKKLNFLTNLRCVLLTKQSIKSNDKLNELVIENVNDDFPLWPSGRVFQLKQPEIIDEFKWSKNQPEFTSFLDTFFLAVDQPNEAGLQDIIKGELATVIPFSSEKLDNIYSEIHQKLLSWYTTTDRKSLISKDKFLKWLVKATGQDRELINPLKNPQKPFKLKWSRLKEETQTFLLQKHVVFQGEKVCLGTVTTSSDLEEIEKTNDDFSTAQELLQNATLTIGTQHKSPCGYDHKYYVKRTVQSARLKNPDNIDQKLLKYIIQHSDDSWIPVPNIKDPSVVEELRPHLFETKFVARSETEFLLEEHRLAVLSDKPGTGKSTILTSFYHELKQIHPDWWIIAVDLNSIDVEKWNLEQFEESFLQRLIKPSNTFEKLLFQHRMKKQGGVVIMLDAFDEIREDRQNAVIKLAKMLLEDYRVDQLFITSRPHFQRVLENELNCFAFTLAPFSIDDQINFMVKYWTNLLGDSLNLEDTAKQLINKLSESIREQRVVFDWSPVQQTVFAGIPLQCRMLAEAYFNFDTKQIEPPQNLNLTQLYKHFVDSKIRIYEEEKRKLPMQTIQTIGHTENVINSYKERAVKLIFRGYGINFDEKTGTTELPVDELKKFGLIYGAEDDIYWREDEFIHRTFAEYFAALHLVDSVHKGKNLEFFLKHVCTNEIWSVLRQFIDSILDLSVQFRLDHVTNNLASNQIMQRALLLPVKEQCGAIVEFVIKLSYENEFRKNADVKKMYQRDEFLHGRCDGRQSSSTLCSCIFRAGPVLHIATHNGSIKMMEILLKSVEHLQLSKEVLLEEIHGQSVFHISAKNENDQVMQLLVNLAKKNHLAAQVFHKPDDRKTMLHLAAQNKNDQIMEMLLRLDREFHLSPELVLKEENHEQTSFHLAAQNENDKIMEKLLNFAKQYHLSHLIFQKRDTGKFTVLHVAAGNKNCKILKMLLNLAQELELSAEIFQQRDFMERTILHVAAKNENETIVKMLLDSAEKHQILADICIKEDDHGNTALHVAASNRNDKIMELLSSSADRFQISVQVLQQVNKWDETIAHVAALNDNEQIMNIILGLAQQYQLSVEVFHQEDEEKRNVLHIAARNKNENILEMLLNLAKKHQLVDEVFQKEDLNGFTVLHLAAYNQNEKITGMLLNLAREHQLLGFLLKEDIDGKTALHMAAYNRNEKVVKMLLDYAIEVRLLPDIFKKRDATGCTVLHCAAVNGNEKIMKILLNFVQEIESSAGVFLQRDHSGQTVLHFAARNENEKIIEMLLNFLTNYQLSEGLFQQDDRGRTVFHVATENHEKVMKMLLISAAQLQLLRSAFQIEDENGQNLFHMAAERGNYHVLNFLLAVAKSLQLSSEVFLKADKNGQTAFHCAIKYGKSITLNIKHFLDWAKQLQLSTKIIHNLDNNGRNVFHTAVLGGNETIVKLLLNWTEECNLSALVLQIRDNGGRTVLDHAAEIEDRFTKFMISRVLLSFVK